jgi:hypothetical protein
VLRQGEHSVPRVSEGTSLSFVRNCTVIVERSWGLMISRRARVQGLERHEFRVDETRGDPQPRKTSFVLEDPIGNASFGSQV